MEHVWIITSKVFSKMSEICSASMYVSGYVSHVKSLPYSPINRCNVVQRNIAPCPTTRRTYSARQSTTFGRAFWYQPLKRKMECNTVWPYAECIQHEYKPLYDHMPKVFGTLVEYVQRSILQARHQLHSAEHTAGPTSIIKRCKTICRTPSARQSNTFGGAYCKADINH